MIRAIDAGDDVLARTLIAHLIMIRSRRNVIGLTDADAAWLQLKLGEVEGRIRARGERLPELPSLGP